jgi:hypothetical protein
VNVDLAALGIAASSAAWIACWQGAAVRRSGPVDLAATARSRRRNATIAIAGALTQTALAVALLGWLGGASLVLAAWMVLGAAFVACANAWPGPTRAAATIIALGGWLLAFGVAVAGSSL